ncbi:MAG: hypothetical protein K2I97_00855, partial [Alistipes sp.]|nr:hypothetical protein [Alistipes sp.]
HIWKPEIDPTSAANLLEYKYTNSGTYHVMPIALGATAKVDIGPTGTATTNTLKTYGLYYQWGRKDPLGRAGALASNTFVTTYAGATGTTVYTLNDKKADIVTLLGGDYVAEKELNGETIPADMWMINYITTHPSEFICINGQYNNDWAGKTNNSLWGNPFGYDYPRMTALQQSIFDPCPKGYRVAPKDLWIAFTDNGQNRTYNVADEETWAEKLYNVLNLSADGKTNTVTTQRGYFLCYEVDNSGMRKWQSGNADFYPTSGSRNRNNGAVANVGTGGWDWSSSPVSGGTTSGNLGYNSTSYLSPLYALERGYAVSVRCVKAN